jgi:uncharacterized membrane protein
MRARVTVTDQRPSPPESPLRALLTLLAVIVGLLEIIIGVALVVSSWHHSVFWTGVGLAIFIAWKVARHRRS